MNGGQFVDSTKTNEAGPDDKACPKDFVYVEDSFEQHDKVDLGSTATLKITDKREGGVSHTLEQGPDDEFGNQTWIQLN